MKKEINDRLNITKEEVVAPHGIWTPDAKVLCYACHGNIFSKVDYDKDANKFKDRVLTSSEMNKYNESKPVEEKKYITHCMKCNKKIQIEESIARENTLNITLQKEGIKSRMSQTGGMNSAIEIDKMNEGFIWITYNVSGDNEWMIGSYDKEGDYDGESSVFYIEQDVVKYIKSIENLK